MRFALDRGDRTLLIVAGLLLVLVSIAGVLLSPRGGSAPQAFASSYSTGSAGAKAAYLLLEELGYNVERWSNPPDALPFDARGVVLVLADPFYPASSQEKIALQRFIRRGGRVLATGEYATIPLGISGIALLPKPSLDWEEFPARFPGTISRQAPTISMKAKMRWKFPPAEGLGYYSDAQGATVVSYRLGQGTVVWWASSSPLTNYGLKQASNTDLFLNCLGPATGRRILWDEYYHGERLGLWDHLGQTPLPWALLQAGLLSLAVILTYSRRSGPVAIPQRASRLSPLEFVETVGDLYARKRAAASALGIAYHRFRSLLAKRLRIQAEATLETIQRAIREHWEGTESGLESLLARCDGALRAGAPDESQTLKLVQELHDCARRLRLSGLLPYPADEVPDSSRPRDTPGGSTGKFEAPDPSRAG